MDITTLTKKFEARVDYLDQKAHVLDPTQHQKYATARKMFVARINAWKKRSQTELATQKANLEEGYQELEAVWHSLKQNL